MRPSVVYCIENVVNGKVYVGSALKFHSRILTHKRELRRGTHFNSRLQRSWNKYGAESFRAFVLETVTETTVLEREAAWIEALCATAEGHGYNNCRHSTNRTGVKNSKSTNKKIGDANRGIVRTPEFCKQMSDTRKGKKLGPRPVEVVREYSLRRRGEKRPPLTAAHKAKLSAKHKGKRLGPIRETLTAEHKAAISRALTGKKRKPFTAEHRAKLAAANRAQPRDERGNLVKKIAA